MRNQTKLWMRLLSLALVVLMLGSMLLGCKKKNEGEEGTTAQVIVPIVSGGDCLGAVAVLSREEGARMGANEMNLARLTADILANQFE